MQRVLTHEFAPEPWTVLDDDYAIIEPIGPAQKKSTLRFAPPHNHFSNFPPEGDHFRCPTTFEARQTITRRWCGFGRVDTWSVTGTPAAD